MSTLQRFWDKVEFTTDCWEWKGAKNQSGYGIFWLKGKLIALHRFIYEKINGKISPELEVDHLCSNRSCVNLNHLEAVTKQENHKRRVKTHCHKGHELTDDNIYKHKDGYRECRTCSMNRYYESLVEKSEEINNEG